MFEFEHEDEAVNQTNDTLFGLAAGVLTGGIARGHRTVAKLEAETSYINNSNLTPVGITFGGYKISGIGRENSHYAIDSYSQVKSVLVEMGDVEAPY